MLDNWGIFLIVVAAILLLASLALSQPEHLQQVCRLAGLVLLVTAPKVVGRQKKKKGTAPRG